MSAYYIERWFRCIPATLIEEFSKLRPEEGYTYVNLLLLIYAEGGPVREDVVSLAKRMSMPRRKVAEALILFIAAGRVVLTEDGRLDMPETHDEIAFQRRRAPRVWLSGRPVRANPVNWARLREAVFARDGYVCTYCRTTDGPFQVDHILARALGGPDEISNLTVACRDCNLSKRAKPLDAWLRERGFDVALAGGVSHERARRLRG